jgi:hypothetical protein
MSEASLVTVEITITDVDPPLSIVLGGPKKQSNDMARALAERFGVPPVPRGRMLGLNMTPAELQDVLPWLKEQFPRIGFSSDPKATRSALLTSAPPSDRAPISPWRRFSVAGADDVTMDQETVTSIAALVDLLYQQRASWGYDPERPIGAVVEETGLRIKVDPRERCVFVDRVPVDEVPDRSQFTPVDVIPI